MKLRILILGALLSACAVSAVDNSDLQQIRKLVEEEKYEEALQKHLWFHEESKKSPGMGGVRLSFALSQWAELGKEYPEALAALTDLRGNHGKALLSGTAGFSEFHEHFAISRTLDQQEKTYSLFKQLHTKHPDIAQGCYRVIEKILFEKKDDALCGYYLKDSIKAFEDARHFREIDLAMSRANPSLRNQRFKDNTDKTFVDKTCLLIEVMLNLNRMSEAEKVQKRALAYFKHPRIKGALRNAKEAK